MKLSPKWKDRLQDWIEDWQGNAIFAGGVCLIGIVWQWFT